MGVGLTLGTPSAAAQSGDPDPASQDGSDTSGEQGEQPDAGPALPAAFDGEIGVSVEKFGVGNVARAGDWAGFLVKIHDTATKPRDVLIRVANSDADGDMPTQQRLVTTNVGRDQSFWVYTRLTYEDFRRSPIEVSVYEAVNAGDTSAVPEATHRPGRLLGRTEVEPRIGDSGQLRGPTEGLIGLIGVGNRPLGLNDYSARNPNEQWSSRGQELSDIVHITLDELPDRWMGLAAMEALVWGSGDVSQLRGDKARAIREWVERGGHLIIVLPTVGQAWTTPTANELFSVMPAVIVERQETADMLAYRPMLTGETKDKNYPEKGVVHGLRMNPAALPAEAMPILTGPDGTCVVARRLYGAGAVTLIGLDLNDSRLQRFIDADIFWHRVLGRRGNFTPVMPQGGGMSQFKPWNVDKDIPEVISVKGASALGALLGFALFALYWLVVGPPGYFLLKRNNLHKHAWLAFAAGSAVFTFLAWGGATALRPFKIDATHLTILDHVYGQPTQRARLWANVLVPRYGTARISVGDASGRADPCLSTIAPWETPDDTSGSSGSFPDSRNYAIDTMSPDAMDVPVRSTVKSIQADWAGPPVLSMPRPVGADGQGNGEIRVTPNWDQSSAKPAITGTLVHDLPFALYDVKVIIVREQTRVAGAPQAAELVRAEVLPMKEEWKPGVPMYLETLRAGLRQSDYAIGTILGGLVPGATGAYGIGEVIDSKTTEDHLLAMSLFHELRPPEPGDGTGSSPPGVAPQRRAMHGMDLSRWFTQPCVIVVGFTKGTGKEGKCPVPLFVDGIELPTHGMTMVRWVYPLPARPPEVVDYQSQAGRRKPDSEDKDPRIQPDGEADTEGGGQ